MNSINVVKIEYHTGFRIFVSVFMLKRLIIVLSFFVYCHADEVKINDDQFVRV